MRNQINVKKIYKSNQVTRWVPLMKKTRIEKMYYQYAFNILRKWVVFSAWWKQQNTEDTGRHIEKYGEE
jgi:hypothetical protein